MLPVVLFVYMRTASWMAIGRSHVDQRRGKVLFVYFQNGQLEGGREVACRSAW